MADRVVQGQSVASLLPAPAPARRAPTAIQRDPAPAVLTPRQQRDDAMREFKASYDALPPGPDRAKALRRYLMVSRKNTPVDTQEEVDWLISDSLDGAESELETWQSLTDDGEPDSFMIEHGEAFPNLIADEAWKLGHFTEQPAIDALWNARTGAMHRAVALAKSIQDEVWERGLPVSIDEAARMTRDNVEAMALSWKQLAADPDEPITQYTRALLDWERTDTHYGMVAIHESMLATRVANIRSGKTVLTADDYAALGANAAYLYKVRALEAAAAAPDDTNKAKLALTLAHPDRNVRLQHYRWTTEEIAPFETAIDNVDNQIVSAAKHARMWRAILWSYERSYMTGEAVNVFKAIYEHPIKTIGTIVGIIGLQAIPGVDVAVDIVLIIEFGLDILQTAADLYDMFTSAGNAHSVVAMEHAAAKMGGIGGVAAKLLIWAATWGISKVGKKLKTYREGKSFLDKHGHTPDARKALADAAGDIEEAEATMAKQREEKIAREKAEQQRAADEAEQRRAEERAAADKREQERAAAEEQERARQAEEQRAREAEEQRAREERERQDQEQKRATAEREKRRAEEEAAAAQAAKKASGPPPKKEHGGHDFSGRDNKNLARDSDAHPYEGETAADAAARAREAQQHVFSQLAEMQPCFVAGTLVLTAAGLMPIEHVQVGTHVFAMDPAHQSSSLPCEVLAVFRGVANSLRRVVYGNTVITATPNHRFFVPADGWVPAGELKVGDELVTADGATIAIEAIHDDCLPSDIATFNLHVADRSTYFVGDGISVLVHNANPNFDRPLWWLFGNKATFRPGDTDGVSLWKTTSEQDVIDMFKIRKNIDGRVPSDPHKAFTSEELMSKGVKVDPTPGNGAMAGRLQHGSARPVTTEAGDLAPTASEPNALSETGIKRVVEGINTSASAEKITPKLMGCK